MEKEGIVRGGFFEGQRAAAFIFSASSGEELDDMLSALPCSAVFGIDDAAGEPRRRIDPRSQDIGRPEEGLSGPWVAWQ